MRGLRVASSRIMVWFCRTVLDKWQEPFRKRRWLTMARMEMDYNMVKLENARFTVLRLLRFLWKFAGGEPNIQSFEMEIGNCLWWPKWFCKCLLTLIGEWFSAFSIDIREEFQLNYIASYPVPVPAMFSLPARLCSWTGMVQHKTRRPQQSNSLPPGNQCFLLESKKVTNKLLLWNKDGKTALRDTCLFQLRLCD